jgi:hypothetical protein
MTISKRKVVEEKKVILTLTLFAALISSTASTLGICARTTIQISIFTLREEAKDGEVMTHDFR